MALAFNPLRTLPNKAVSQKSFSGTGIQFGATGPANLMNDRISRKDDTIQGDLSTINGHISVGNSTVTGKVTTMSGEITIDRSDISGEVTTMNGDITVLTNSKVGRVSTLNGNVLIDEGSIATGDVTTANGKIILSDATVNGDVSSKNNSPKIQNSRITGKLQFNTPSVTIKNSTIGSIQVDKNTSSITNSFISGRNNTVVIGGSIIGADFAAGNGVQIGLGSTSTLNGYKIKPDNASQTTLTTPGGTVYVNGDLVSGDGPATYAELKAQNRKAPSFPPRAGKTQGSRKKTLLLLLLLRVRLNPPNPKRRIRSFISKATV
jgi:hypothetical protein